MKNKKKNIMLGLIGGALLLTLIAIFMGFLNGITQSWTSGEYTGGGTIKFWDLIFNKTHEGKQVVDLLDGSNSVGLIVGFAFTILMILVLATIFTLNFINKSNKKLNLGLMICCCVILLVLGIIFIGAKGICGIPDSSKQAFGETTIVEIKNKLEAGPICWSVFCFIADGCMIGATILNKKLYSK